jgi:type I restriction enzyme S subunit
MILLQYDSDNLPYENDYPFDIPDNWLWLKHNDLFEISGGSQPPKSKFISEPRAGYIRLFQIRDYGDKPVPVYIPESTATKTTKQGDILLARYGASLGKVFWAENGAYNVAMAKVIPLFNFLSEYIFDKYLYYYYHTDLYRSVILGNSRSAQAGFNKDDLENMWFPLPPIAEQMRIVNCIEQILPLVELYGVHEERLINLNHQFPELLKKSILQEAVQGKLVPQDPNDEPASILLECIRAEKQKLIAEGKIKKDKHESVIFRRDNSHYEKLDGIEHCIDGEIPFDIPDSWAWTSVGEVCTNIQYGSSQKSSLTGKIAVLRMGNLQNGRIVLDKLVYTSDSKEIEKYPLEYNDLLFNRTNSKELVGKVAIYKSEIPAIYAGYLVRLHPLLIDSDYLNYVMQSQYYWIYCQNVRSDAIGQSNINAEKLKRFIFPLPPLQEQKRIVNQISCAMSKIEHL